MLAALLLALVPVATAQEDVVYLLEAQFIDRFTQLIEWPSGSNVGNASLPFVVGVIGQGKIQPALEALAAEIKFKGQTISVRNINQLSEIDSCHLLFIASSEKSRLSEILNQVKGKPILTIGDTKGFAKDGVMISFSAKGQTIKFKVNPKAADEAGLRFSDTLLALGEVVN